MPLPNTSNCRRQVFVLGCVFIKELTRAAIDFVVFCCAKLYFFRIMLMHEQLHFNSNNYHNLSLQC